MKSITIHPTINFLLEGSLEDILNDGVTKTVQNHVPALSEVVDSMEQSAEYMEAIASFLSPSQSACILKQVGKLRAMAERVKPQIIAIT